MGCIYSSKKLSDVLQEFKEEGPLSKYNPEGDIDYEGFQLFMDSYLEIPTPRDLVTRLFLSFVKRPPNTQAGPAVDGRLLKMAAVTSTTACAPITSHTTAGGGGGSLPELAKEPPAKEHHSLAEKLHGFTEKLHSLGHRCDSESNSRGRAGFCSTIRRGKRVSIQCEFLGDLKSIVLDLLSSAFADWALDMHSFQSPGGLPCSWQLYFGDVGCLLSDLGYKVI
ncbi:DAG_kinase_N domain-containing protein [Trichonephila clavata]|uniref:DAG_kinase_N domain-containing protein n=1 Tax=Trichonephila clavata TaxID=2740835 RepID=A0A8X6HI22_TRICU|nr:DAG_kinase_N domain-containing protein [Trichonephila clavata]